MTYMPRRLRRSAAILKSLLCVVLIINLHVVSGGCGPAGAIMVDGRLRILLTPDHPLTQTLAGSVFEGASALEVDPITSDFHLVFPDASRNVSGAFSLNKNVFAFSRLHLEANGQTADLTLDDEKHVTSIETSLGQRWERPEDWVGLPLDVVGGGVDAYLGANIELVGIARALDGELVGQNPAPSGEPDDPASPDPSAGKPRQSAQDSTGGLDGVLSVLAALLGLQLAVSNFPAVFFAFQLLVSVQLGMAIAGMAPSPGTPPTGGTPGAPITGTATLLVVNSLTDGTPIWFVTLIEDPSNDLPGGNLLGDEAIPAGSFRDFAVPPGLRDINVIVPHGIDCFLLFQHKDVVLEDGEITELRLDPSDVGVIIPEGCGG